MNKPDFPDPHEQVNRLFPLHPPADQSVRYLMDRTRAQFIDLAHWLVDNTPAGPDQTVMIRKLHDASQAAIGNIACNQDKIPEIPE